jgi:hypothetical protein
VDVLFLFPLKKKNQKENSPLAFSSMKVCAKVWPVLPEESGGGRRKVREGLARQLNPNVIARDEAILGLKVKPVKFLC